MAIQFDTITSALLFFYSFLMETFTPGTSYQDTIKRGGAFILGLLTFILLLNVAYAFEWGSDTPRHEQELSRHFESFEKQQKIVDQAKETQMNIKGSIISSMIDVANSKIKDISQLEEVDQIEIARLGIKAKCLKKVYNANEYEKVVLEELCEEGLVMEAQRQ
jgi:hypothetical protein